MFFSEGKRTGSGGENPVSPAGGPEGERGAGYMPVIPGNTGIKTVYDDTLIGGTGYRMVGRIQGYYDFDKDR